MHGRFRDEWRALLLAVGLLTRIPVPGIGESDARMAGRSLHWYPAAGLVVALPLALVALVSPAPPLLTAALVLACWVAITGAMHLDGLADCADAWVGGMGDREKTLTIMKDPASGPVAVAALVVVLMLKLAALAAILSAPLTAGWWLAPVVARATVAIAFVTTPYVRPAGMGEGLGESASPRSIALATAVTLVAAALVMPSPLWWLWLVTAAALFLLWCRAMLTRLGGFTGDGAGALVEVQETALLVAAALALEGPPI